MLVRLVLRVLVTGLLLTALATGDAQAELIMLVPADGDLAAPLAGLPKKVTAAIATTLERRGAKVEIAKASRIDILTLADCPDGSPSCLGKVTKLIKVDAVVLVTLAPSDAGAFVDVSLVHRDGRAPVQTSWAIDGKTESAIVSEVVRRVPELFGEKVDPPAEPAAPAAPPVEPTTPAVAAIDEQPPGFGQTATDDRGGGLSRVKLTSWLLAGAGVGLIGVGTVFMLDASDKQSTIDGFDPRTVDDFRELEQIEDDAASRALLGNILLGAGVVTTGVAATLIVLQLRSGGESDAVAVSPLVFDGGAGVALTLEGDL